MWQEIGGFLGGAGQFIGGANSLFGDSDGVSGRDIKDAMKARMAAARIYGEKFGFHPLAALGINPAQTGGQRSAFTDTGRAMANMGQGLDRMLSGRSKLDQNRAEYYSELAKSERYKREKDQVNVVTEPRDSTYLEKEYGLSGQGDAKTHVFKKKEINRPSSMGLEGGTAPLEQKFEDRQGYRSYVISQSASEPFESEFFHKVRRSFIQAARWGRSISQVFHRSPEFVKQVRLNKPKAPAGYTFLFDIVRGQYKRVPEKMGYYNGRKRTFLQNYMERGLQKLMMRNYPLKKSHKNIRLKKSH